MGYCFTPRIHRFSHTANPQLPIIRRDYLATNSIHQSHSLLAVVQDIPANHTFCLLRQRCMDAEKITLCTSPVKDSSSHRSEQWPRQRQASEAPERLPLLPPDLPRSWCYVPRFCSVVTPARTDLREFPAHLYSLISTRSNGDCRAR
jgi:hypothetical protein